MNLWGMQTLPAALGVALDGTHFRLIASQFLCSASHFIVTVLCQIALAKECLGKLPMRGGQKGHWSDHHEGQVN